MNRRTACGTEHRGSDAPLHLAFDLGWTSWKLGFSTGLGQKPRLRTIPARDLRRLLEEIAAAKTRFGLVAHARVVSCYEAGRDGFWLHRFLLANGVANVVVDSSSIEVNRRRRRSKSDRLDAEKLLRMLQRFHLGEVKVWSVVRVPSEADEDARHLHRELRTCRKEHARTTNRIRGLLASQGVAPGRRLHLSMRALAALRLWDGSPLPAGLRARLTRTWTQAEFLAAQIRELVRQQRATVQEESQQQVRQLAQLRGIGGHGASVLVREMFGWRRFCNRREVGSLGGLTPTSHRSGAAEHELGISSAGLRPVRGLMIELAWLWRRYQPKSKLTLWYQERFEGGGSRAHRIGIVALARRLLIALWRYAEFGVVPEGAEFKT